MSKLFNNIGGRGGSPRDHPTIPVLANLKANKTSLQLIIHLLAEWNNIEIRQITEKRGLLADLTLLWSQILNQDQQLVQLWRRLIVKFKDELKLRWEQALQLRVVYENALGETLEHLKPESVPQEEELALAEEANDEAMRAAKRKLQKRDANDHHNVSSFGIIESGLSNRLRRNEAEPVKLDKLELSYRQKNAHFNCKRRQFVTTAEITFPALIDEQQDLALTVKKCVLQHSISRNKINCSLSRSNSNLTTTASWISPFKLIAPLHEKLARDLQLPRYTTLHYYDPREGRPRERVLFGAEVGDEEDLENGILLVLLKASELDVSTGSKRPKPACQEETVRLAMYLEARWYSNAKDNLSLVLQQPKALRHSLISGKPFSRSLLPTSKCVLRQFYLSCLPTPLLPITPAEFTQFGLKMLNARTIIHSLPPANVKLLRKSCEYIADNDGKLLRQFGKHVTRVKSDLMGDGSNEKTLECLMEMIIRSFQREKERMVLDISPMSATY